MFSEAAERARKQACAVAAVSFHVAQDGKALQAFLKGMTGG
ncbi:MAG TPA: hypothetical protein VGE88_07740 [Lysobacter sp.]